MKTNNETHEGLTLDEKIALLLTEVKKITKHLKLDRRGKNDNDLDGAENPDESDKRINDVLELVKDIHRCTARREFTPEQKASLKSIEDTVNKALREYHNAEHREIKSELEAVRQALDELKARKRTEKVFHYHSHTIEVRSSKVVVWFFSLSLAIAGLLFLNAVQYFDNARCRDNDLKYRFIQMHGGADLEGIMFLRDVFEFRRDEKIIREMRRRVGEYEREVRLEIESNAKAKIAGEAAERAKNGGAKSERLQNETETVKGGRK